MDLVQGVLRTLVLWNGLGEKKKSGKVTYQEQSIGALSDGWLESAIGAETGAVVLGRQMRVSQKHATIEKATMDVGFASRVSCTFRNRH